MITTRAEVLYYDGGGGGGGRGVSFILESTWIVTPGVMQSKLCLARYGGPGHH